MVSVSVEWTVDQLDNILANVWDQGAEAMWFAYTGLDQDEIPGLIMSKNPYRSH